MNAVAAQRRVGRVAQTARVQRSDIGPAFENARVHDAMRVGVITCGPDTVLADVARLMTGYGIHCVIVADVDASEDKRPWGVVDALDVAAAGAESASRTAGEAPSTDVVPVESNATLTRAARLMAEHGVTHLVAVDPGTNRPVGVIGASGLAAVLVWGES
jgi:CBS domain-containing protein